MEVDYVTMPTERLQGLLIKEQINQARYGISCPPHITMNIEDIKEELRRRSPIESTHPQHETAPRKSQESKTSERDHQKSLLAIHQRNLGYLVKQVNHFSGSGQQVSNVPIYILNSLIEAVTSVEGLLQSLGLVTQARCDCGQLIPEGIAYCVHCERLSNLDN